MQPFSNLKEREPGKPRGRKSQYEYGSSKPEPEFDSFGIAISGNKPGHQRCLVDVSPTFTKLKKELRPWNPSVTIGKVEEDMRKLLKLTLEEFPEMKKYFTWETIIFYQGDPGDKFEGLFLGHYAPIGKNMGFVYHCYNRVGEGLKEREALKQNKVRVLTFVISKL